MPASDSFFKRNEKVIMVVLLALIAPTFAFTGIIAAVMGQDDPVVTKVFGEEIKRSRLTRVQSQMFELRRLREGLATFGALATQGQFNQYFQVSRADAIDFIMWLHEAERLGVRASDVAVAEQVREVGRALIVHHQMMKSGQSYNPTDPDARNSFLQKLAETRWTKRAYVDALTDPAFGKTTPQIFERQMRHALTVSQVQQLAFNAATVAEKEVWERFCIENELRKFDILRVATEKFEQEARDSVTPQDNQAAYLKYQYKYRLNNRVRLEVAKRSFESVKASKEEVEERYEQDKDALYVNVRSGDTTTYHPLEVRYTAVERDVKQDKLHQILEDFLVVATSQRDQLGEAFVLSGAIPADEAHLFEVFSPKVIERGKEREADERIQNVPEFQDLLSRFAQLNIGDLCEEPVATTDGVFVWRIVNTLPSEAAKYQDIIPEITEDAVKDKRQTLASAKLEEWKKKIEEDSSVTLESIAEENELTIVSPPAVSSRQFSLLKVDDVQIPGAASIVREGFQLTEPGSLTPPVNDFTKDEIYLARFAGREDPTSEGFEQQRQRLENQILGEKRTALYEAYAEDVATRAKRTDLVARNPDGDTAQ